MAVLTGNVLKDPDYIYRYHTGALKAPMATAITPSFGNKPVVVPNDEETIAAMLSLGGLSPAGQHNRDMGH